MLKHVQISPLRNRSDSLSLRSATSCASSLCGSPEPQSDFHRTPSRASSYSSLNDTLPQTTIKVYTSCLRIDIEYKTLGIQWDTTSKEVIAQLLRRLKMRHRDPRLFYLSMEVTVRRAGVKTLLVLDDEARPAILQACHPKGDSRFCLQLKPGGLIRVHTSVLQSLSQYKSLVISEETTSDELLTLLLSLYSSTEPVEQFSLYEVCPGQEYQRKLHPDDIPLRAQIQRHQRGESCHFLIRRNPNYPRRRQLLPPIIEKTSSTNSVHSQISSNSNNNNNNNNSNNSSTDNLDTKSLCNNDNNDENNSTKIMKNLDEQNTICIKCHNNFKSCEFCHKNSMTIVKNNNNNISNNNKQLQTYNPVYNIREIRTSSHSFSSLGIDKKLLDIEQLSSATTLRTNNNNDKIINYTNLNMNNPKNSNSNDCNGNNITNLAGEIVNSNPAKGFGHYVYI